MSTMSTVIGIHMTTIGDRLREERERLGMSQPAFGAVGGVQKQAQLKYEKGERYPDALYLEALTKVGVDVLYLITGIRGVVTLAPEENLLLDRFRASAPALKDAALRVLLGGAAPEAGAFHSQVIHGDVGKQVSGIAGNLTIKTMNTTVGGSRKK